MADEQLEFSVCAESSIRAAINHMQLYRLGSLRPRCRRADGASVAAWMVEHGEALDWLRFSHGAFAGSRQSRRPKVGIWVGTFQAPLRMVRGACGRREAGCQQIARYHQPAASRAERLFVRAPADMQTDRVLRGSQLVSAELRVGRQA